MAKEKTTFKPGNPGRRKGSKNKSVTREKISEILRDDKTWTKFNTELMKLKGRPYVDALTKLFEYDTAKFQSISMSLSNLSENDLEFLVDHIRKTMTNESEPD